MEINTLTKTYLVINKLSASEKILLKRNISALNHFYLVPEGVLVCSQLDDDGFVNAVTLDIVESQKVTILNINCRFLGKSDRSGNEAETVFDK